MDKLLELVQEKAGISADQAQKAIEAVVGFMKDKLPGPIGDQVAKFVDGGDDEGGGDDDGGMLGGITDKLGGMLGG
ncbi:MAG: hypothetical protein HKO63_00475 [Acidimicrobiia bacterium]|nr:hypothetical protein [Acidimicrobiia bacterium]MBT8193578.1 hypothetical protein [Acidimicrobiia bacterium]NNJ46495.1 hypothetical protein [Acidimicrobiia bacterium]NNL14358.1 hypothetical protein [Acidimicrobiia bacterium]NNL96651.1 hypothetical protein [Acidimicrobiia bacterium]